MNLGGGEIIVILLVAVIVLGPDKLPSALRMFGRTMAEVRKYQNLAKNEIEKAMSMTDDEPQENTSPSPKRIESRSSESDGPIAPIIDDEDQ